jgi:exonuclease SbcD
MKKVIGILANDIHLNKNNGTLVKDIFQQAVNVCKKYGTNNLFCGGDVFTNRSGQPLQCLTDWREILLNLQQNGIRIYAIPGNHDKTSAADEKSYLDVYSDDCLKTFRTAGFEMFNDILVAFIPYFDDERWLEEYKELEKKVTKINHRLKILITHSGFDGVMNNDGSKVESIIKPAMFTDWTKVLIGHYHNASQLADNVFYTGSVYQNNFGETVTDKGFTVIYADGSIEFVPSEFPRYIKETIYATDKETLRNLLEKYTGETYHHIRFIIKGTKRQCQNVSTTEIVTAGIDVKFEIDELTKNIEASEQDTVLYFDRSTMVKTFLSFCQENEIKGENLKFGLKLIKNIENVES